MLISHHTPAAQWSFPKNQWPLRRADAAPFFSFALPSSGGDGIIGVGVANCVDQDGKSNLYRTYMRLE